MMDRINISLGRAMTTDVRERLRREEGQALAEYALILGLVVVGVVAVMTLLGKNIISRITSISNSVGPTTTTTP
jgi:pilus assembly protein Flp/PilA